jgi:nucleotide-binding universal stress UspA family protein
MDDRPILICYDGSDAARRGIDAAARVLAPRRAIILDVAPYMTAAESYAVIAGPLRAIEVETLNTAQAMAIANEGAELARAAGLDAEARGALASTTYAGVLDVADEVHAAAIVVGSRGLTGIRERLEHSLSHQLAEHSKRPVLIVPAAREY